MTPTDTTARNIMIPQFFGPEDLRVSKHHSTCLTVSLSHIPSRSGTSENSRRWPGKLPQQSPHSMLPSLRENRLHRCHQTRLSESEANFSIIRNTFDRQLRGAGGGDEPGDSGWHIYSTDTTHKVNEWGPSVQHREVRSVLCGEANGQEI